MQERTWVNPTHEEAGSSPLPTGTGHAPSQEDRIRQALGIAQGALPKVECSWLQRYYEYLIAKMSFPFEARYPGDRGPLRQLVSLVNVVGLVDPAGNPNSDDWGLLCTVQHGPLTAQLPLVDMEVADKHPNAQFIEDYWYWFWNWRFDPKI